MAFTYSGDPSSSDRDYIRFAIGDTNSNTPILQDAEIDYVVNTYSTNSSRLAVAYRAAATALGAKPAKKSLGPQSEDATKRLAYYNEQATKYETISKYSGSSPLPDYQAELVFEKDMMANET